MLFLLSLHIMIKTNQFRIHCDIFSNTISDYLVTMSTGTLKIFATLRIVSICLPTAAAI